MRNAGFIRDGSSAAADGALLVGDDHHGVIYRIAFSGPR